MSRWLGIMGVATVVEYLAVRQKSDDTLSGVTRDVFHTNTRLGRAVFVIAWGAFSAWYAIHVIDSEVNREHH